MPLYTPAVTAPLASGSYYFPAGQQVIGTSATLGVGTLHVIPWVVGRPLRISHLCQSIPTIGDAGSKVRLGVYADNGGCYPGALLVDAGTINGDSATVQELPADLSLSSGVYWLGAAVQVVTTTQPTLHTITNAWTPPVPIFAGTTLPSATFVATGYGQTGVTGALPATFTSTVTQGTTKPRVFVKIA